MKKDKKVWVKIQNNGEVDLLGLSLLGVSSKREEDNKIGFFGSGNKYSIALLLNKKIDFKIFSGDKEIKIRTKPVMFRGNYYEQIFFNNQRTSLTTSMGPDWETWFAIREFYCNAIDEGGEKIEVSDLAIGEKGKTNIYVELTGELKSFFKDRNRYILTGGEKTIDTVKTEYGDVSILPTFDDEFIAYRKRIRIIPENKIKSLYSYNFERIEINESRTYKYIHELNERIAGALGGSENISVINNYLRNWKGTKEAEAQWEYVSKKLSKSWVDILSGKRVFPESLAIMSGDFEGKFNSFVVPDKLAEKISKEVEGCEVVGYDNEKQFVEVEKNNLEKTKIEQALNELSQIGYTITSKIVLAQTKMSDVVGWYEVKNDTIYLTREHLGSVMNIKNTLLEEHFHAIGHRDGQREFVTFLIDELIRSKSN